MLQFDWLEFLIYQKDSPCNFHSFPLNLIIVIFLDSYIIYDSGNVTWGLPSVGFDYWVFGTIVELLQSIFLQLKTRFKLSLLHWVFWCENLKATRNKGEKWNDAPVPDQLGLDILYLMGKKKYVRIALLAKITTKRIN